RRNIAHRKVVWVPAYSVAETAVGSTVARVFQSMLGQLEGAAFQRRVAHADRTRKRSDETRAREHQHDPALVTRDARRGNCAARFTREGADPFPAKRASRGARANHGHHARALDPCGGARVARLGLASVGASLGAAEAVSGASADRETAAGRGSDDAAR